MRSISNIKSKKMDIKTLYIEFWLSSQIIFFIYYKARRPIRLCCLMFKRLMSEVDGCSFFGLGWTCKLLWVKLRQKPGATPTLQRLCSVLLDHYGELQDQLGSRLQEGLQQPQHVDICVLKHHGPVPAPLMLLLAARHDPQVQGPDVPAGTRALTTYNVANL